MGKLHELLAVEPDLRARAQRATAQTKGLFADGRTRLIGQTRKYSNLYEGGETFADEITDLATSVSTELATLWSDFGQWMDAAAQKEITNQKTKADVVIDGESLLEQLPAPALLNLESKLAELRQVYVAIPTLDPTERWEWDKQRACFVSEVRTTYKTKKVLKSHVAYEATTEHQAQVETFSEDVRVGDWATVIHSGMLTPARKRELLNKFDMLARAVKQARQRANEAEVISSKVADAIYNFIHRE